MRAGSLVVAAVVLPALAAGQSSLDAVAARLPRLKELNVAGQPLAYEASAFATADLGAPSRLHAPL